MTLRRTLSQIRRFGFLTYWRGCAVCSWPRRQCSVEGYLPERVGSTLRYCALAKAHGGLTGQKQES
jgi:hypothetical protein